MFIPPPGDPKGPDNSRDPSNPSAESEAPSAEEEAFRFAFQELERGTETREVRRRLVAMGWGDSKALDILGEAIQFQKDMDRKAAAMDPRQLKTLLLEAGKKNMTLGGLWFGGGLLVTLGTLAAASGPGGGSYVVAWGAVIFGAGQFLRGLGQYNQGQ